MAQMVGAVGIETYDLSRVKGKSTFAISRIWLRHVVISTDFPLSQRRASQAKVMSAFAVAIGCKADMTFCSAHVRF